LKRNQIVYYLSLEEIIENYKRGSGQPINNVNHMFVRKHTVALFQPTLRYSFKKFSISVY